MPIRVLHIISHLKLGGAQICLKQIVENASKDKIEHFIYPLRAKQIDMPIKGNILKFPYPDYDTRKFFEISRICKKHDIDIIHAHLEKPAIAALLAKRLCKLPVIIHEHGSISLPGHNNSFYRFMLKRLWKKADVFISVSKSITEDLVTIAGVDRNKIELIYNCVDDVAFKADLSVRNNIRESLKLSKNDIVLGFAGRLVAQKGLDILIRSMQCLTKKSDQFKLLVAGEGRKRKELERLSRKLHLQEKIRFLGFCENIQEVMCAFDIGLIPSRQEPFGIIALEFMRMKIPIITSGVDGLGEFVEDNVTGLITPNNTPEDICNCILRLVDESQLRKTIIENAYNSSEDFGLKQYTGKIENLYIKLFSNG